MLAHRKLAQLLRANSQSLVIERSAEPDHGEAFSCTHGFLASNLNETKQRGCIIKSTRRTEVIDCWLGTRSRLYVAAP